MAFLLLNQFGAVRYYHLFGVARGEIQIFDSQPSNSFVVK